MSLGKCLLPALYVHFPFCRKRCIYCDFNTYGGRSEEERFFYWQALLEDIRDTAERLKNGGLCSNIGWWGREVPPPCDVEVNVRADGCRSELGGRVVPAPGLRTVYFGGGTPTLVPVSWLVETLETVRANFGLTPRAEITLEANPGTLTLQALQVLRRAGFNRLSMGVQSLNEGMLRKLGRIHTAADVRRCFSWARQAGFTEINLDLIYGLPGQTVYVWRDTLKKILALEPEHLSCYALSVEEGTPLALALKRGLMELPSEDEVEKMEICLRHYLRRHNFHHYEISNWAKPGFRSRHNGIYWKNLPYLGLGAGAVSYWRGWRFRRLDDPLDYARAVFENGNIYVEAEHLGELARFRESVMLGLRRRCGIDVERLMRSFPPQTRKFLSKYWQVFLDSLPDSLIRVCGSRVRFTSRGRDLSSEIFLQLF